MSETPKLRRNLSGKVHTYVCVYVRMCVGMYVHAYMWRMGPPAVHGAMSCGGCICVGLWYANEYVWSVPLDPTSHSEKLGLASQTRVCVVCVERAYMCAWYGELKLK